MNEDKSNSLDDASAPNRTTKVSENLPETTANLNKTDDNQEHINTDDISNHDAADDTPMPPTEPIPAPAGWSPKKKSFFNLGLLIALPFTPTMQQTNNAFVKGQTTIISPQVSGYVTEVAVQDFASVETGDLLVKIDDRTFQQQLEQAQANIDVA